MLSFFVESLERWQKVENLCMDFALFAVLALYFVRGFFKGFVGMLFSLIGIFFIIVASWKLCNIVTPAVEGLFGENLNTFITRLLDKEISGKFSSIQELENAVGQSKFGLLFGLFLFKILGNLSIDGSMSAGQILAPTVCALLVKVISFVVLFVAFFVGLKILRLLMNRLIKKFGLSTSNRIFGGVLGVVKGLIVFGAFYVVFSTMSNLLLNESLLSFVQSGKISYFIYNNFIPKILKLIY